MEAAPVQLSKTGRGLQTKAAAPTRVPDAAPDRRDSTRLHGHIHVVTAASPRLVSAEYPRRSRGVAATRRDVV